MFTHKPTLGCCAEHFNASGPARLRAAFADAPYVFGQFHPEYLEAEQDARMAAATGACLPHLVTDCDAEECQP